MLKDRYETQTEFEPRDPKMRYGITETLPIDIFIETCNLDYNKIMKRSNKIKKILDKCEKIRVIGKEINGYKTDLIVELTDGKGKRREFIASDCDVRTKYDIDFFKKKGIKAGLYANFPSGEAFVTPENVKGLFIGDVVINIDQSYIIPENKPLIIEIKNNKYNIIDGPKKMIDKMRKEKAEAKQKIRTYEKSKSLPASITQMYRKNFNAIGEFAINTNPKAKVCDYLIVNEKIARMIHIALGMGFEPDRKTIYHWDIVINSPRQKLDIYGIDKNKKIHWIIKKGKFTA
jgi:leucyl aminopeptidase (aminopeptidase T)